MSDLRHLCADGFLSDEDVVRLLSPAELAQLESKLEPGQELPATTLERVRSLVELGVFRRSHSGRREEGDRVASPIVIAPHGTVSHEVAEIRMLLVGFAPVDSVAVRNLVEPAVDTRFRILHADGIAQAAITMQAGDFDIALVSLVEPQRLGMDALARAELLSSEVPVVPFIRREDEPQALHLGLRDYLVRGQLDSRLIVKTLRNAVEHRRLSQALETSREREHFHASRDSMTGLPNRMYFQKRLESAIERASLAQGHLAVMFLDLDRFKNINDTLGHAVGDQLILTIAERLAGALRDTDLVARVGGDEFVMLLDCAEVDDPPANIAGKLLDRIARPVRVSDHDLSVTASIGIATYPADGQGPDTLIRNADAALYQAKASGRDTYQFYSQSVSTVARRRLAVENKLRKVIGTDALELYYQPRVDVGRSILLGSEALLRWVDPELGLVPPEELISVAEDSGLIVPLGDWAIRQACSQQRAWQDMGFRGLGISVNVSSRQVQEGALRESVLRTLWTTGLDPSTLELELTESALIEDPDGAAEVLRELREIGVSLALDDFGTGFSSLSHLRRFPVNAIKIHQSFVRDILIDGHDAAIIEAMISIGEKLRLRVVAEGVESEGQRDFLMARGCPEMQGYLFGPPMTVPTFEAMLCEAQQR